MLANDVIETLEIPPEGNRSQTGPRASNISGCDREMWHQVIDWDVRPPPNAALRERFRRGHEVEGLAKRRLEDAGWEVVGGQMPFAIEENGLTIVTGHIDGRLRKQGDQGLGTVFEIKSLHPSVWARIDSIGDFFRMSGFWHRYPRQMLAYLWGHDEEHGLLILDDCLGHLKVIDVVLWDWTEETENLLARCRRVATALDMKRDGIVDAIPDYTTNRKQCLDCWARGVGICTPAIDFAVPGGVIDDAEMADDLAKMQGLRASYDAYRDLDKTFKAVVKATIQDGQYVCGDYKVTRKTQQRKNGTAVITEWEKISREASDGSDVSKKGEEVRTVSGGLVS